MPQRADVERMAAERRHRVDDRQRAVLARDRRQLLDRVQHAGRRFRVHHRHDVGRRRLQRAPQRVGIARPAPLDVEPRDRRAVALAHLREPIAEVAGDDDERARALAAPGSRPPFPSRTCRCPTPRTRTSPRRRGTAAPAARARRRAARIISGSRWLTVGDAIARITRGAVRLGPGPSRMRSVSGSRLMRRLPRIARAPRCSAATAASGSGSERRTRQADVVADELQRRLQSGTP